MKSKLILGLLSLFMVFSMTSCMEKVDAGCEGIKVNLYGNDKGVDDVSLVTGAVWYNRHQWNHFINKPMVVRNYIYLFTI